MGKKQVHHDASLRGLLGSSVARQPVARHGRCRRLHLQGGAVDQRGAAPAVRHDARVRRRAESQGAEQQGPHVGRPHRQAGHAEGRDVRRRLERRVHPRRGFRQVRRPVGPLLGGGEPGG
nr:MAG TPA: hypothetical protein [Caudoviricetes sp.]